MYIPKSVLWGCGLVLLFVIAGGLWWAGFFDGLTSALKLDILSEEQQSEPAPQQQTSESELATGNDSSDQALESDLSQLDAELESYSEAEAELDSSLEDESVEQEY